METYTVKPDSVENDGENGQPATWRRKVNQAAAPFSALLGIVVIFAGVIFATFWITRVTPSWIKLAADAYARQLVSAMQVQ